MEHRTSGPRLIPASDGSWIAVTDDADFIFLGATGNTEAEALVAYDEAVRRRVEALANIADV